MRVIVSVALLLLGTYASLLSTTLFKKLLLVMVSLACMLVRLYVLMNVAMFAIESACFGVWDELRIFLIVLLC
jgi:hypothetical protein